MTDAAATPATPSKAAPQWLRVTILIVTGLLYSYALWNALAFLLDHLSTGLSGYGWFVLIFAVVFPLIAFGVVYAIASQRSVLQLLLVALTGLAVVAVFWLNVLAHYAASSSLFAP